MPDDSASLMVVKFQPSEVDQHLPSAHARHSLLDVCPSSLLMLLVQVLSMSCAGHYITSPLCLPSCLPLAWALTAWSLCV